ncbi:MAG: hypothetical protein COW01_10630 [Bdellovibrionales bacterium CG12_big_fil_rev_8_21_14_0_65_38_15]|nr:MAG: hypothetical protein COW79_07475 [Bdellovibrionales bacterium CG22_combo_CG10-13_8_21_14_all_38_13]PIQ54592.1 MAG: hypothetical protein COW01_10630 [Bdellovibrionales bacterium CG12_big_fil_rev_8_21_14_0_65_38_15]PIR29973.1 MAG: hypothetical protein COV38_08475 [Bdellovibrionales bacterium CG11_big_fil_rev_8_21_14_0_20_38_13]
MKTKVISFIVHLLIRALGLTYRFEHRESKDIKDAKKSGPNGAYLYALWHQNIVASILSHMGRPHVCIVSASKDGELVAVTLKMLGHKSARGSSSKGGQQAMMEMTRIVNEGTPGAISVDGPRGPAKIPKKGIFEVAKLTGAPIIPLVPIPLNFWSFKKSWDQFRLPKPFSKIIVFYGRPIYIDKNIQQSDLVRLSEELTAQLNNVEINALRELQRN